MKKKIITCAATVALLGSATLAQVGTDSTPESTNAYSASNGTTVQIQQVTFKQGFRMSWHDGKIRCEIARKVKQAQGKRHVTGCDPMNGLWYFSYFD